MSGTFYVCEYNKLSLVEWYENLVVVYWEHMLAAVIFVDFICTFIICSQTGAKREKLVAGSILTVVSAKS